MKKHLLAMIACLLLISSGIRAATPIRAGEAFVTRFSGVKRDTSDGRMVIDTNGTVGSIIDLRYPRQAPRGQHWYNEPQRDPIYAADAGQVFGIAIDNHHPANIYVAATAKYGLHRNRDNTDWMLGQWGFGGGPGTIYILRANHHYQPEIFANVTLHGRRNTGASLGNIVYDKWHHQLFVSDLETGMIHRIDISTAKDRGYFDHGVNGRHDFINEITGKVNSLPAIGFNSATKANTQHCATSFDTTPHCWNLADLRRRVYGLGIYRFSTGRVRLYYSAHVNKSDKQSAIWSIGITKNGRFNRKDVRLEFMLPSNVGDSHSFVSDIAFSNKGEMLVAETGPFRNLGLGQTAPFHQPHNARLFLYVTNADGLWQPRGQYNVGNVNQSHNPAALKSKSASGGVDFGYGYNKKNKITSYRRDQFVWMSGDALCSPKGPCLSLYSGTNTDSDQVHGVQGVPKSSYILYGAMPSFMINSYMIDTDINTHSNGAKSVSEARRNDETKIGDIEIAKGRSGPYYDYPIIVPYHSRYWSHGRVNSHRKYASHARQYSHKKYGSHTRRYSHKKYGSHSRQYSHKKYGSHTKRYSHKKYGSHSRQYSHKKYGSHAKTYSHAKQGSHTKTHSHSRQGSHTKTHSHSRQGSHSRTASHAKQGSHNRRESHAKQGSHNRSISDNKLPPVILRRPKKSPPPRVSKPKRRVSSPRGHSKNVSAINRSRKKIRKERQIKKRPARIKKHVKDKDENKKSKDSSVKRGKHAKDKDKKKKSKDSSVNRGKNVLRGRNVLVGGN